MKIEIKTEFWKSKDIAFFQNKLVNWTWVVAVLSMMNVLYFIFHYVSLFTLGILMANLLILAGTYAVISSYNKYEAGLIKEKK